MQSRVVLRSRRLVSPAGIERSPFFVGNLLVSSSHTPTTRPRSTAAISARWQSTQTSPSSKEAEAPEAPTADSDTAASRDAAAGSDGQEQLRQRLYDQIIRVNQVRSAPHHMWLRWALHVVVLTVCGGVVVCLSVRSRPESWEHSRSTPGSCSSCAAPPTSLSCRYSLLLFDVRALNVRDQRSFGGECGVSSTWQTRRRSTSRSSTS
jgi:hypothetical protein